MLSNKTYLYRQEWLTLFSSHIWQRIYPHLCIMDMVDSLNNKASFSIIITTKGKLYTGHEEARLNLNRVNIRNKSTNNRGRENYQRESVSECEVYCYLVVIPGTHTHKCLSPRIPCLNQYNWNDFAAEASWLSQWDLHQLSKMISKKLKTWLSHQYKASISQRFT